MYLIVSSSISNKLSLYDMRKSTSTRNQELSTSFVTFIPTLWTNNTDDSWNKTEGISHISGYIPKN